MEGIGEEYEKLKIIYLDPNLDFSKVDRSINSFDKSLPPHIVKGGPFPLTYIVRYKYGLSSMNLLGEIDEADEILEVRDALFESPYAGNMVFTLHDFWNSLKYRGKIELINVIQDEIKRNLEISISEYKSDDGEDENVTLVLEDKTEFKISKASDFYKDSKTIIEMDQDNDSDLKIVIPDTELNTLKIIMIFYKGNGKYIFRNHLFDDRVLISIMQIAEFLQNHKILKICDDYLIKPFEPEELLMRIQKLLNPRLNKNKISKVSYFGDYQFDDATKTLKLNNINISLTSSELTIIEYFVKNINKEVDREEISKILGDRNNLRSIDVTITRLRKKLTTSDNNSVLRTIRGKGYKLVGEYE